MRRPGESPQRHARVLGGLLGLLAGEGSRRSGDWHLFGEAPPVGAAAVDLAHGYIATRGRNAPLAVAARHRGVPGVGWLLPVAMVRADRPPMVSDTLALADAAGFPGNALDGCVAFVELASRILAGMAVDEAVHGVVPDPVAGDQPVPRLSGNAVMDGLVATAWALTRSLPLTDIVVLLRHTAPQEVIAAVGGVLGLRYGADAMPRRWRQRLPRAAECVALAPALVRRRAVSAAEPATRGTDRSAAPALLFPLASQFPHVSRRRRDASDVAVHFHDHWPTEQEDAGHEGVDGW